MSLSQTNATQILTNLGFRVNTASRYYAAVKNFQRGYGFGNPLAVDGIRGPKTDAALTYSESRRQAGLGTASAHFSFSEFKCKCGGAYSDCARIWIPRALLAALETSRAKVGHAIHIISGCRCVRYNASIGGASQSRHLYGDAADWQGPDKDTVETWRVWHGIGYGANSDTAKHTDLRPTSTVTNPMEWVYPGW